jgi:hypothetical protein
VAFSGSGANTSCSFPVPLDLGSVLFFCSVHDTLMFPSCSLFVPFVFSSCFLSGSVQAPFSFTLMFLSCSFHVHFMFQSFVNPMCMDQLEHKTSCHFLSKSLCNDSVTNCAEENEQGTIVGAL